MLIRAATRREQQLLQEYDTWIPKEAMERKIEAGQVYAAFDGDNFVGWLRYGFFWDNTPFMNMLRIKEAYRGKGFGRALAEYWENEMKQAGYRLVLTSTSQTEYAQHFYNKLGYRAVGSFTIDGDPLEIIFAKYI